MKRVYSSASLWEAREILALLQQHRIPAMLLNENVAGTPGILPFNPAMTVDAEVWVVDTDLAERCARLIAEFQAAESSPGRPGEPAWRCAGCGEENPPDFDLCWSCGRPK
ncbi:MAG: DUF2007 domain-containing protein [Gammaproteobacteria bacterium]